MNAVHDMGGMHGRFASDNDGPGRLASMSKQGQCTKSLRFSPLRGGVSRWVGNQPRGRR